MKKNPRNYPETMPSAESGRLMTRGEKEMAVTVDGQTFAYMQPGWWCSLTDPDDMEGQLVDEDNQVAQMAKRTAKALAGGETFFVPVVIRAIREQLGLSQREAGIVFGTGEKSFEKYESGEIQPSGPTKQLLKMAAEKPEWFQKPKPGDALIPAFNEAAEIRKVLHQNAMDRIYAPLFERYHGQRPEPT